MEGSARRFILLSTVFAACMDVESARVVDQEAEAVPMSVADGDAAHLLQAEEVPVAVRRAAQEAMRGFVLERAVLEVEGNRTIFSLRGSVDEVSYEVDVSPAGEVLEVERTRAGDDGGDRPIRPYQIPEDVKRAAREAVPGLVVQEAELETEASQRIYCVHGTVGARFFEVEVLPDGRVLDVEAGGEEQD